MQGMRNPLYLSRVKCMMLRWTHCHKASHKLNPTSSLEYWINCCLIQHGGGGLRLLLSWHTHPHLVGSGSVFKRLFSIVFFL
jgi:hypothetical protein